MKANKGHHQNINKTIREMFVKNNKYQIENKLEELKACSVIRLPIGIYCSVAKIKAAFNEYLKFVDYEFIPNEEDLKVFTGGELKDKDFSNYKEYFDHNISLCDICINNLGEKEWLYETISDNSYEKTEKEDAIYESLNLLKPLERSLLIYAFGLDDHSEMSTRELSIAFQMSEEMVEKNIESALQNMKKLLATMM